MPPVVIAAGIGAAASIGGGLLAAGAQGRATRQAAQESERNRNANNALVEGNRQFAFNALDPYSQGGLRAQNALQGMLFGNEATGGYTALPPGARPVSAGPMQGRPDLMVPGATGATGNALAGDAAPAGYVNWNAYLNDPLNSDARADYDANHAGTDVGTYGAGHWQRDGARRGLDPYAATAEQAAAARPPSAWDQFRNSTNYQFRYNEGMKGLNLGLANNGMLGSGMAAKEAIKYGQNFASNEVNNYINLLQNQQSIGGNAASSMVGANNGATNALMQNNTMNAQAQGGAALMRGQQQTQLFGTIAQGIGQVAGAAGSAGMFGGGSSYSTSGSGGSYPRFGP